MTAGWVTPTEAGIVAVVYALLVGVLQRNFPLRELGAVLRETVQSTALIMYIIAVSMALSWVFISEGTGAELAGLITGLSSSPIVFLLIAEHDTLFGWTEAGYYSTAIVLVLVSEGLAVLLLGAFLLSTRPWAMWSRA